MTGRLKVLHLIPSFTGGGAERQLSLLASEFVKNGIDASVGFMGSGVYLQALVQAGVPAHRIACLGNHDPFTVARICRLIAVTRPHIVQTWLTQMDVFGGAAAHIMRAPHLLSERASRGAYPPTWKTLLRRVVGRRAHGIVANSEAGLAYWRHEGSRGILRVIRNGLPIAAIDSSQPAQPSQRGYPKNCRLVLGAGRLVPQKGWPVLLDAFDRVLAALPDVHAVIFGEGEQRGLLERHIAQSPYRSQIRLEPFTRDIWSWMRVASVVVSNSGYEGSPNVVLEAMLARCPLVVSDIGEHREILDDSMAVFCDPRSAVDVARGMMAVLQDGAGAARRVTAARLRAEAWTIEAAARDYAEFYRMIANG